MDLIILASGQNKTRHVIVLQDIVMSLSQCYLMFYWQNDWKMTDTDTQ